MNEMMLLKKRKGGRGIAAGVSRQSFSSELGLY